MKKYVIKTGTVTYAIKGRDLLRGKGFKVRIERMSTDNSQGCSYAIILDGELKNAEKTLRENGVKILDIKEQ